MGKKRLRPWLEKQINARTFPGLKFIENEKRIFSFPWKDQKKKGTTRNDEATQIIKAWATYKGWRKENDPDNLPLWKSRLRIALTKLTDIAEVRELHKVNDQTNPYRAYKFITSSVNKSFVSLPNTSSDSSTLQELSESQVDFPARLNTEANNVGKHTNIPTVVYEIDKFQSVEDANLSSTNSFEMSYPDITCGTCSNTVNVTSLYNQRSDVLLDLTNLNGSSNASDMPSVHPHQSDELSDLTNLNESSYSSDMMSSLHEQSDLLSDLKDLNGSFNTLDTLSLHHQQSHVPSKSNVNESSCPPDMPLLYYQQLDMPSDLANVNENSNPSVMPSLHYQQSDMLSDSAYLNESLSPPDITPLYHQQSDVFSEFANLSGSSNLPDLSLSHHQKLDMPSEVASVNGTSNFPDMTLLHHQQSDVFSELTNLTGSCNSSDVPPLRHQQSDVFSEFANLNGSSNSPYMPPLHHQQSDMLPDLAHLTGSSHPSETSQICHQREEVQLDFANLNGKSNPSDMLPLHHQQSDMPSDLANIRESSLMTFDSNMTENNASIGSSLPSVEVSSTMTSANRHILKIKGYFMENCILEDVIDEQGARLFCGDLSQHIKTERVTGITTLYGPMNLKQIHIQDFDGLHESQTVNGTKLKTIQELQRGMERGLILRAAEDKITAERLCRSGVFLKTQEGKTELLHRKASAPLCVFDFGLFMRHLHSHIKENGPRPLPFILISFGQEYTTNKKTFFYIKVTHIEAERLLVQAVNNKPDNVDEIVFSSANDSDNLADCFKNMLSFT